MVLSNFTSRSGVAMPHSPARYHLGADLTADGTLGAGLTTDGTTDRNDYVVYNHDRGGTDGLLFIMRGESPGDIGSVLG